jgi:regulation of enolase protein 1 (concanavalin A-like superfamily)
MENFHLAGVPAELQWRLDPVEWTVEKDGGLAIRAGAKTDLFTDPKDGARQDAAPAALFVPPDRDFMLSARVTVGFASTYDAGVLHVRLPDERWAKLCFEYSPQGEPMIVSVVNRGVSDDCNSVVVAGTTAWLRVSQSQTATAFHYSLDGTRWSFVRYFSLGPMDGLRVGFSSQSPTGKGCRSEFSNIRYAAGFPRDLRSGE